MIVWDSEFLRTRKFHRVFEIFIECQVWGRAISEIVDSSLSDMGFKMILLIFCKIL